MVGSRLDSPAALSPNGAVPGRFRIEIQIWLISGLAWYRAVSIRVNR